VAVVAVHGTELGLNEGEAGWVPVAAVLAVQGTDVREAGGVAVAVMRGD
jgi:hypothetical protein